MQEQIIIQEKSIKTIELTKIFVKILYILRKSSSWVCFKVCTSSHLWSPKFGFGFTNFIESTKRLLNKSKLYINYIEFQTWMNEKIKS